MALLKLDEAQRSLNRHTLSGVESQPHSCPVMLGCLGKVTTVTKKVADRSV
jgi:hypothetical protein